ncbi:MAG: HAD-IA family hydrolase [Clostridia bacterium]|nr:HAD-IA family hydrolase [Clostridia bacterium]
MKNIFLLDLDETLLDFKRAERENFFRTASAFGIAANETVFDRFHAINDGLWKALERGETTRERLVIDRFAILFGELCVRADEKAVAEKYFRNFTGICYPFAGAAEFLRTLSERGRVYIVTNGSAPIQKSHIADAGFSPYLSGTFISEEAGFNKPDVRFARYAEQQISDYNRENAVWLGDSLTSDRLCAERAGIDFVLYAPEGAPQGYPGAVARNYGEALERMK